jgi:Uma2 family endonuclease
MAATSALVDPQEYLRREAQTERRSEFVDGVICEMAGASRNHVEIRAALTVEIGSALRGKPCRILGSDVKVRISARNTYYYPDATVSCPPNFIDDSNGVIDDPKVVFEILSASTHAMDRGQRFADYRTLTSLHEYVLIESESRSVEVFSRVGETWSVRHHQDGEIFIPSIDVTISMAELYRNVRPGINSL